MKTIFACSAEQTGLLNGLELNIPSILRISNQHMVYFLFIFWWHLLEAIKIARMWKTNPDVKTNIGAEVTALNQNEQNIQNTAKRQKFLT